MKSITLALLVLLAAITARGQQQATPVPFSGTIQVYGIFQKNSLVRPYSKRNSEPMELRLTITPGYLVLDSIKVRNNNKYTAKIVLNRERHIAYFLNEKSDPKRGSMVDLGDKKAKMAQNTDSAKIANKDTSGTLKTSIIRSGIKADINGFSCEKYLLENKHIIIEMWMTDKAAPRLSDFRDIVADLLFDRSITMLKESMPKLPAEFINSFPIRIIARPRDTSIQEVVMLEVRSVSPIVEPGIANLSDYSITPRTQPKEWNSPQPDKPLPEGAEPDPY